MNGVEEKLPEARERELQDGIGDITQRIRALADNFHLDPSQILSLVLTELEKNPLKDNQVIMASAKVDEEQRKVELQIEPLPLSVYKSDPLSKPSDELVKEMREVLNTIQAVTCMGDQSLALVASRVENRFDGIIRLGNENTDHAFLDVYERAKKVALERGFKWRISNPLLVNALLGRSDGTYDQRGRDDMSGKAIKLIQSKKLNDISILYIALPEVANNGLSGSKRGNPAVISIQFADSAQKIQFEILVREYHEKATNALFSLLMSYDNFETLLQFQGNYERSGEVKDVKQTIFSNRDVYNASIGTVVGTWQEGLSIENV